MHNHFQLLLKLADPRQISWLGDGLLVSYWHH
jgi:hypothetical protein